MAIPYLSLARAAPNQKRRNLTPSGRRPMKDLPIRSTRRLRRFVSILPWTRFEGEIRKELTGAAGEDAEALRRLLDKIRLRLID